MGLLLGLHWRIIFVNRSNVSRVKWWHENLFLPANLDKRSNGAGFNILWNMSENGKPKFTSKQNSSMDATCSRVINIQPVRVYGTSSPYAWNFESLFSPAGPTSYDWLHRAHQNFTPTLATLQCIIAQRHGFSSIFLSFFSYEIQVLVC